MDDDVSTLHYTALDPSLEQIRLLEILSISPHIVCKLSVISLLDAPIFSALSYMWGSARVTRPITIEGVQLQVTTNLAAAIEAVDYQWMQGTCADEPLASRRLWADAVCINQEDTQEKNSQIPLMGKIYSSASRVFSWLTLPEKPEYDGFAAFEAAGKELEARAGQNHEAFVDWAGFPDLYSMLHGMLVIVNSPYWTRVWVAQELTLGQNNLLIHGEKAIPLSKVVLIRDSLAACQKRYMHDRTPKPEHLGTQAWIALNDIKLPRVLDLKKVKTMLEGWDRLTSGRKVAAQDEARLLWSRLQMLLSLAKNYYATDPKDYIYGFAGLLGIDIVADYSATKTVASVYVDVVQLALHTSNVRNGGVGHDLSFLSDAGIGQAWEVASDRPSWCPNFANLALESDRNRIHCQTGDQDQGFTYTGLPLACSGFSLRCGGILLDRVERLGELLVAHGQDSTPLCRWIVHAISRKHINSQTGHHRALALLDAIVDPPKESLISDKLVDFVSNRDRDVALFVAWLALAWSKDAQSEGLLALDDALHLQDIWAGYPPDSNRPNLTSGQAYTDLNQNLPATITALLDFALRLGNKGGLRVAETARDYIGLFPPRIANGDTIAMLDGCSHPVFLRDMGGYYAHVGVGYISGYMSWDIQELLEKGLGERKIIEVR